MIKSLLSFVNSVKSLNNPNSNNFPYFKLNTRNLRIEINFFGDYNLLSFWNEKYYISLLFYFDDSVTIKIKINDINNLGTAKIHSEYKINLEEIETYILNENLFVLEFGRIPEAPEQFKKLLEDEQFIQYVSMNISFLQKE